MTGIPPATAASKLRSAPFSSAILASSTPDAASSALLAVTTWRPRRKAARTESAAAPSAPPISSTNTSISAFAASSSALSNQVTAEISIPRSRVRSLAVTAAISIGRPQVTASSLARVWMMRTSEAPTVPRPAMPTLRASAMIVFLVFWETGIWENGAVRTAAPQIVIGGPVRGQRRVLSVITLCIVSSAVDRNFLMLRAAWRMRCSFSTSARRT